MVYPVEVRQTADSDVLRRLAPRTILAVRVDRSDYKKVVIDWRQPIRTASGLPQLLEAVEGELRTWRRLTRWSCPGVRRRLSVRGRHDLLSG